LSGKVLENVSVSKEIRILKALKFLGGELCPYSFGFLSYDPVLGFSVMTQLRFLSYSTAMGFSVMTFLHGDIELLGLSLQSQLPHANNVEYFTCPRAVKKVVKRCKSWFTSDGNRRDN